MDATGDIIAHVRKSDAGTFEIQTLRDHQIGVAELAEMFVKKATGSKMIGQIGYLLGLLHDTGKNLSGFQRYIKRASGIDTTASPSHFPHSPAGAIYAHKLPFVQSQRLRKILSVIVAAHHRGLYDDSAWKNLIRDGENRGYMAHYKDLSKEVDTDIFQTMKFSEEKLEGKISRYSEEDLSLLIRILFSCLIDADFLDTERFMTTDNFSQRGYRNVSFSDLREKLREHTRSFRQDTPINSARKHFLETCIRHGQESEEGIYSLFLPTGGGKTLSSMAWALEKAIEGGFRRIIYVIPYTSIISQTAATFKKIFGEENVLEHHSDIDFEDDDEKSNLRQKLNSENWDAPIIVTTNVQFFESLYSNRVGRCRKLHNIPNSVVIFDEVQTFPPEIENPMIRILKSLHECFRVQVLLCTATLPILDEELGNKQSAEDPKFFNFEKGSIMPVVPYDRELFSAFDKVDYHMEPIQVSAAQLADELLKYDSFLCVVNTRKEAHDIYQAITERTSEDGVIHLSKQMCSKHIKEKIEVIKKRLIDRLPVKVVSTQLIEAGVDLDFPVVFRALAGLDSIIQAAGRCNREGKLEHKGLLQVFRLEGSRYGKNVVNGENATRAIMTDRGDSFDPNDLELIKSYFKNYYERFTTFDEKNVSDCLYDYGRGESLRFDFENAARDFRYIKDDTKDILVPYSQEGKDLIQRLVSGGFLSRENFRLMSKLSVGLYDRQVAELMGRGFIKEVMIGESPQLVITDTNVYDENIGVKLGDPYSEEDYNR